MTIIELNEVNEGRVVGTTDDVIFYLPLQFGEDYDKGARATVVFRERRAGEHTFRRLHVKETDVEIKMMLQLAEKN